MGSIKKGVLLLALGHENYFKMAVNLAASIKYNDPGVQVALINEGVYPIDTKLFDHSIVLQGEKIPHSVKTKLYELSPFDSTLYLDVDMIMLNEAKLSPIFEELGGIGFTVMNVQSEACIWATPEEVREYSGNSTDPMYIYYSELIYFEKSKEAKAIFTEAQKQLNSKIANKKFAGGMADELAFILAAMKLGVKPHQDNWTPVFWYFRSKKEAHLQPYQLTNKYLAYSIGGNETPQYVKASYNNLVTFYSQRMGINRPFKAIDKRNYLPSRAKI